MAREQLDAAPEYDEDVGSGGASSSCGNRRQQRVRADLMLSVLYDMLGRYDESDKCLNAAFDVREDRGGGVGRKRAGNDRFVRIDVPCTIMHTKCARCKR